MSLAVSPKKHKWSESEPIGKKKKKTSTFSRSAAPPRVSSRVFAEESPALSPPPPALVRKKASNDEGCRDAKVHLTVDRLIGLHSRTARDYVSRPSNMVTFPLEQFNPIADLKAILQSHSRCSAYTDKSPTQSGGLQVTRLNYVALQEAAASQMLSVSKTLAFATFFAESRLKLKMVHPVCSYSTSFNRALCLDGEEELLQNDQGFLFCGSADMIYNCLPVRLCLTSITQTVIHLVDEEMATGRLSQATQMQGERRSLMVRMGGVVRSNDRGMSIWASWAIVNVLTMFSQGREILSQTPLTHLDVETARICDAYGRAQIARRSKRTLVGSKTCQATRSIAEVHLEFWLAAMSSNHACILATLVSNSAAAVFDAVKKTLSIQAIDNATAAENPGLTVAAFENAKLSCESIASLVNTPDAALPFVQTHEVRTPQGTWVRCCSVGRNIACRENAAVHLCKQPRPDFVAPHMRVGWVECFAILGGPFVEAAMRSLSTEDMSQKQRNMLARAAQMVQDDVCRFPFATLSQHGTVRGVLAWRAKLLGSSEQEGLGQDASVLLQGLLSSGHHSSKVEGASVIAVTSCERRSLAALNAEPRGRTSCFLVCGVLALNLLMEAYGSWRRSKPLRLPPLCQTSPREKTAFANSQKKTTGLDFTHPLLVFTDLQLAFKQLCDPERESDLCGGAFTLVIAGDRPVRLTEALLNIARRVHSASRVLKKGDVRKERTPFFEGVLQLRSMLFAGCITASNLADVAKALGSGKLNTAAKRCKRVEVPDCNLNLHLTANDVYLCGAMKVQRSYARSAWEGSYPPGIDTGVTGGVGLRASSIYGDGRLHAGSVLMDQDQVDAFALAFTEKRFVSIGPDLRKERPLETKGIPFAATPGVHAFLDYLVDGLESHRKHLFSADEKPDAAPVLCMKALPFGPFSERLSPLVVPGTHHCVDPLRSTVSSTEHAFQVDATLPELGILREPLFKRLSNVAAKDNCLQSPYDSVATFLNVAVALGIMAKVAWVARGNVLLPKRETLWIDALKRDMDAFVRAKDARPELGTFLWAADGLLLINAMYPKSIKVAEACVLDAFAQAPAKVYKEMPKDRTLETLINKKDRGEARVYWASFSRQFGSAWPPLRALIVELMSRNGTFENTKDDFDRLAALLDGAIRAAWYVHSVDGVGAPPSGVPLAALTSPDKISHADLAPVFVANFKRNMEPRGSLIAMKPSAYHQLLSLMMAVHLPNEIFAQVHRNEGAVTFRTSSVADLEEGEVKRSDKATHPLGVQGEEAAFGTEHERRYTSSLQRRAFRKNNSLLLPLFLEITPPLPYQIRDRGFHQEHSKECPNGIIKKVIDAAYNSALGEYSRNPHPPPSPENAK